MKPNLPIAIDLFSGCGGFSTGLLDAGVRVVAGFDHEARAIDVYNYNHAFRGARGHVVDLSQTSGQELLLMAGIKAVDILVGGPPCQAFSIIGKQQGLEDARGQLLFDFVRYIEELQPQAFILENVPNLAQVDDGRIFDGLRRNIAALGYAVQAEVLSVADYGVPQMRRRLFMLGIRGLKSFPYPPKPTHGRDAGDLFNRCLPHPTVRDAIDNLPDVHSPEAELIPNHEPTSHSPSMIAALEGLAPGTREPKSHHDRLHPDRLAYTLRAGSGNFSPLRPIHYKYPRVITVRESARSQGFADTFIWPDRVPRLQQYRQVGNAVPPPVAAAVCTHLCEIMGWPTDVGALAGVPSERPPAITMSAPERQAMRNTRIRGASLGGRSGESFK